jgi:biogenesis of lysosome-related organelles complex 1 subunit 2
LLFQQTDAALEPHLNQLVQIEDSIIKLEKAAYELDAYAKRLEAKFKAVKER